MCERRVNLLVYSLSLHRHSYIGFILAFASSIHDKQTFHLQGRPDPSDCGEGARGCGYRKFQIDSLGDHLSTCTALSGTKKAHDWAVDQLVDLFRTTHNVKTQQVTKSRGHHRGNVELTGYDE